jgi:hypothetical protein
MTDIESLIQQLQGNSPNKRYDACEELRVMALRRPLPQAAIDALHSATKDTNPDVAEAAQRALAFDAQINNTPKQTEEPIPSDERGKDVIIDRRALRTERLSIGLGMLGGFLGLPLLFAIFVSIQDGLEFLLGPGYSIFLRLLVGGVIGILMYNIRKQRKESEVLMEAFLAGLIGTAIISFCVVGAFAQ